MDRITFTLKPEAPFRLDFTAWLLRRRAENLIDRWKEGDSYRRVIIAQRQPVEVEVTHYEQVRDSIAPWNAYGGLIYFLLLLRRLAEAGCLNAAEEALPHVRGACDGRA